MTAEGSSRSLGQLAALAYVVGTVVGTGIYLKPGLVAGLAGSPQQALGLWALGGLFVTAGAVVYSHLARAWPDLGGAYLYLHRVYGSWAASLLLAADVFLARPAAVGALATGLGLVWGLSPLQNLTLAAAVITLLVLFQLLGSEMQGRGQVVLTALQMLPLLAIVAAGVSGGSNGDSSSGPGEANWSAAFLAILWAYDGWYNLTNLAGEVKNPVSTFPRALVGGTVVVTLLYLILNGVLFTRLSAGELSQSSVPFLLLFDQWGISWLGKAVQLSLTLALLATLNGTLACGARVMVAASKDGLIRRPLGEIATKPRPTLCFGLLCLGLLALFGGLPLKMNLFDTLTELTAVVVVLLTSLTVTCLFHGKKIGRSVPVSAYGAAVFYLVVNLILGVLLVQEDNRTALTGSLAVLVVGTFLWLTRRPASVERSAVKDANTSLSDPK